MLEAALWGGVAGSTVLLGAVSGMVFHFKRWLLSAVMAFGTGALLGAATFELLGQSILALLFHLKFASYLTAYK
ncbi:hypothetical protein MFMK1_000645 [Metallumcola ferriviriculae]|uniref:Uncharacterized protein n=1 Tax=Metallumcola ferriviriculae TaxID=3039180 RepID=A0AAU0UKY0_9FIRM|nr:hypothetical protein MFMK1_000645 [Desulfitibacteraceae bacterium MK1]